MTEEGLRERTKARRRTAILRAAYTLFAERGYAETTVADIAAAAEVAPRTVALYFPTKQDIALSRAAAHTDLLADALRRRVPGELLTEVIGRWLHAKRDDSDGELWPLSQRMFRANPELRALLAARMTPVVEEGRRVVAEDAGLAADATGPRVAAAAAVAVLLELADSPPGTDFESAVTTALSFLDAGLATLSWSGGR